MLCRERREKNTIKSVEGTFEIETPQDRNSSFELHLVKKRQQDNLSEKIIGLYGLEMSYRDIVAHIKEMYDTDISHTCLARLLIVLYLVLSNGKAPGFLQSSGY